jgi:diaminopimelate epimerase
VRNAYFRGHGLGNDYLVLDPEDLDFRLTPARVRRICDRDRGVGSDGILLLAPSRRADFGVRIFNPDGSEAEKSGNGLRILARYLHATGRTRRRAFRVETRGGVVGIALHLDAHGDASRVSVEIGRASFAPEALPCTLPGPELLERDLLVAGRSIRFTGVSVGNPHCVVFAPPGRVWSRNELLNLGSALECHHVFPRRANVQLAWVTGKRAVSMLIWERGAGETASSGTSASAVACAGVRLGRLASPVRVTAPGGVLEVEVSEAFDVTLEGPAEEVSRGHLSPAFVRGLR